VRSDLQIIKDEMLGLHELLAALSASGVTIADGGVDVTKRELARLALLIAELDKVLARLSTAIHQAVRRLGARTNVPVTDRGSL
jgi:hypothetical protein